LEFHFGSLAVDLASVHVETTSADCGLVEGDAIFIREIAVLDAERSLVVGLWASVALQLGAGRDVAGLAAVIGENAVVERETDVHCICTVVVTDLTIWELSSVVQSEVVARTSCRGHHSGAGRAGRAGRAGGAGGAGRAGRAGRRGGDGAVQLDFECNLSTVGNLLSEDVVASGADSRLIEDGASFVHEVAVARYAKIGIV